MESLGHVHHEEKDNEAASIKHITVCEAYIEQRREMANQLIQLVECNSSDAEYGQRFPAKWRKMINKEKHKDVRHILYDWGIFQEGDEVPNSEMESTMLTFCSTNVHRAMTGSGPLNNRWMTWFEKCVSYSFMA